MAQTGQQRQQRNFFQKSCKAGVMYAIEARNTITAPPALLGTVTGTGQRMNVAVPIDSSVRFYRLVEEP